MRGSWAKKHRAAVASVLAAAAVVSGLGLAPVPARATTLDELQAQIDSCSSAFDDAVSRANDLQDQIAANEARVSAIEQELPDKREAASQSLRTMYKLRSNAGGVIELLLSSESFNDVITTVRYLDAVVSRSNAAIDGLVSASDELSQARDALESEKAQADEEVASAMSSLTQANQAREQYEAQLAAEKAAAEKAAAEAAAQAQKEAEEKAAADAAAQEQSAKDSAAASSSQSADSAQGQDAAQGSASSSSDSGASSGTSSGSSSQDVKTDGEWMSGLASAYDLEDNTGGTATASGIPLTHDSMTVAVPVSQSYLLGRTVEIRYAGKTITATVTDTGGFASYGRVLDLAGGCWQAFGYSSADDWGVRAVQYRFL